MLMHSPTPEDVASWKHTAEQYRGQLRPNRISGRALYAYLQSRYPLRQVFDEQADAIVRTSILENECFAVDLPKGVSPEPVCCFIERSGAGLALYQAQDKVFSGCDIFVGIDLASGYFTIEGSSLLWDELFAQRGLNETDLSNEYAVAEYIACLNRFGRLEQTLESAKR